MRPFCIFGAGIVSTSIYTALKDTYHCKPITFLVSEMKNNPTQIDGIPVKIFSEWDTSDKNIVYLIAVPESHHSIIADLFRRKEVSKKQIVFIDNNRENQIVGDFCAKSSLFITIQQMLETERPTIEVFQAQSHMDRILQNTINSHKYICPIQVGANLTDKVFIDRRDNIGDNISTKNRNYCELTASYYAWKHSQAAFKGLCHYRRIFDINDEQMGELLKRSTGWDVILPYPSIHYPNIAGQHLRYINETDWCAMRLALKETAVEYYNVFDSIFQEQFFYNFNMLIARQDVFDDYCNFLFSVLSRTEELTTPKGWERSDRFAGYLGENLTTLYFMANKDRLKILHAGKIWLT